MPNNDTNRILWVLVAAVVALAFLGIYFGLTRPGPDDVVTLGANFSNPVDIEGTSSAAAPALTFEDDTDSGFFRSAANTLNIATGGTERLEIDSTAFTIVPGLDVDSSLDFDGTTFDVDASGSIDLTSTEAAADAIFLDANGTVTTGVDIDLGSVSGMTIDGGLVDVGGGTCGVADGDNDVCIAAVLEVDGELEADGAVDMDAGATIDGGVTNIGGGSPGSAAGDNDLYVTADLEVDGVAYIDASIMLPASDATAAFTATAANCGHTYFLSATTEFQTILPAMSAVSAGCTFQFIVKAAPSGASYTVITGNSDEDTLIVGINELEVDDTEDGPYDASADTITFVDGTSVVGDYVYLFTDGTMWYGRGQANADGGVTITDSD